MLPRYFQLHLKLWVLVLVNLPKLILALELVLALALALLSLLPLHTGVETDLRAADYVLQIPRPHNLPAGAGGALRGNLHKVGGAILGVLGLD